MERAAPPAAAPPRYTSRTDTCGTGARLPALAAALLWLALAAPASASGPTARAGIVIDDLGYRLEESERALRLPGALTYAVLPHTPFARRLLESARRLGKEVILHLPMEARGGLAMGPGGLASGVSRQGLVNTLEAALGSVPDARGVSNHMGSLLTADHTPMRWLMQALARRGSLYFVDSRTTALSVAYESARALGIPAIRRDVFLDNVRERARIVERFIELVETARRRGVALAIGHPHPETLAVLQELLGRLGSFGVELVPVSRMVRAPQASAGVVDGSAAAAPRAAGGDGVAPAEPIPPGVAAGPSFLGNL